MYNAKDYEKKETSEKEESKYSLIYDRSYYNKNRKDDIIPKMAYIPTETLFFD